MHEQITAIAHSLVDDMRALHQGHDGHLIRCLSDMTLPWHHSSCDGGSSDYKDTVPIKLILRAAALYLTLPRPHVPCQLPSHAPRELLARLSEQQASPPMLFHPSPCRQHPNLRHYMMHHIAQHMHDGSGHKDSLHGSHGLSNTNVRASACRVCFCDMICSVTSVWQPQHHQSLAECSCPA